MHKNWWLIHSQFMMHGQKNIKLLTYSALWKQDTIIWCCHSGQRKKTKLVACCSWTALNCLLHATKVQEILLFLSFRFGANILGRWWGYKHITAATTTTTTTTKPPPLLLLPSTTTTVLLLLPLSLPHFPVYQLWKSRLSGM